MIKEVLVLVKLPRELKELLDEERDKMELRGVIAAVNEANEFLLHLPHLMLRLEAKLAIAQKVTKEKIRVQIGALRSIHKTMYEYERKHHDEIVEINKKLKELGDTLNGGNNIDLLREVA